MSWSLSEKCLIFELEASVWPDSIYYEPPLKGEYTCYKRSQLVFEGFEAIDGLKPMERVRSSVDANDSRDFGNIDDLEDTNDGYLICGDFGLVVVTGGTMQFVLVQS